MPVTNATSRFKSLASLAVAGMALGIALPDVCSAQVLPERGRPNVLFIAVDDLKPTIGAYGDRHAITPNIDRLAARGTVFLNAHCQQAVCAPSRASLLTGLRPDQTRVWDLQTRFREHNPDVITLPQHFKNQGYHAVGMGKVYDSRSTLGPADMDAASWSRPYITASIPADATLGYRDPQAVHIIQQQMEEGLAKGVKPGPDMYLHVQHRPPYERADVADEDYKDGHVARRAAQTLKELAAEAKPFFLAVGFDKPHLPFNAPAKYWDLYDPDELAVPPTHRLPQSAPGWAFQDSNELRNRYTGVPPAGTPIPDELQKTLRHGYYAATSYVDAQIGVVLDALEESGQIDNTIVVLWGDHGYHLGDHGMWCKHTNYEQATRSPLIIAAPPGLIAPSVTSAPVELIDIYLTLCELAGVVQPGHVQGTSLVPTMRDPTVDVRPFTVSQYPRNAKGTGQLMGYALRDRQHRYVQWRRWDRVTGAGDVVAEEWYDLQADPHETRNIIGEIADEVAAPFRAYAEVIIQFSRPLPAPAQAE